MSSVKSLEDSITHYELTPESKGNVIREMIHTIGVVGSLVVVVVMVVIVVVVLVFMGEGSTLTDGANCIKIMYIKSLLKVLLP